MDMNQIILDRSCLFDKEVTICGQSKMRQFEHKNKKIKLLPLRPKISQPEQTSTSPKKTKGINLECP